MTDSFVFMQLKSTARVKQTLISLPPVMNCDVSMVQSTNCIIILVPIPSLPQPLYFYRANKLQTQLLFLSSAKYRLPNEKTCNPLRKPSPHKTLRETASHAAQYYTAAIQNVTFKANHIHRSVICASNSQILPLPHFYIPQNVNPHNKTPALKQFSP